MAFYGRKKEIDIIKKELERGHSSILLYGRRRFGKTSLLREVLNSIDGGVKLLYTCKPISLFDNAKNFSSLVFSAFSLPFMYIDDFEKMVTGDYFYVDKTLFIKDLLDMKGEVNLFTRPRRFGKTLNMSMLRYFFEENPEKVSRIFQGLNMMCH